VEIKTVAVITGDIINSSKLSDEQKNRVKLDLEYFTSNNPDILLPLQFYRGDSFQLMVEKEKAARIAVFIEAIIYSSVNTFARISIGIGLVSKIVPDNVLQSEGEAFQLSGHQMDTMKEEGRLMKITLKNNQYQSILSATFYLAESIILGWKPGMAAVIAQIPFAKSQKEIAEKLNISGAAVSKALKAGNWPSMENFLNGFEESLKEI
jgi:predicted transcriptional regulator